MTPVLLVTASLWPPSFLFLSEQMRFIPDSPVCFPETRTRPPVNRPRGDLLDLIVGYEREALGLLLSFVWLFVSPLGSEKNCFFWRN